MIYFNEFGPVTLTLVPDIQVRDLLSRDSKKRLDVKEHPEKGVYVKDLSIHKVRPSETGQWVWVVFL